MAIDDLGLDLGNLDNLPDIDDATAIATGANEDADQDRAALRIDRGPAA